MNLNRCFLLLALWASPTLAILPSDPLPGGSLEAILDGKPAPLPLLRTDAKIDIRGDLATVRLTQTFANPYPDPIHARYIFPLPADAAVYAMRMKTPSFILEGQIREKQQAAAEFEKAKSQGKQAALLEQERPNVFVQQVANLMPGAEVQVELQYAHAVPKLDGRYELTFPMVVGPRYVPDRQGADAWTLPDSPPLESPSQIDEDRVRLTLRLEAGQPIQNVESPTHPITTSNLAENALQIQLTEGRALDNKDFVLRYSLAGWTATAGATAYAKQGEGFVSLLLEPPAQSAELTAREMIFVLDCSGSMYGPPLEASKRFMRAALRKLRPGDLFRILRFSDTATAFSREPLPATPENIQRGLDYINILQGEGGTEMSSGIRAALEPRPIPGALRIVVFLTDGYIGDDMSIVRLVGELLGEARLFSFGVGDSINHFLLQQMARAGHGVCRIVRPEEDASQIADGLARRLEAPYLTDVSLDWGDAPVDQAVPAAIPDLFLGQSLRVIAHFKGAGEYKARLRGKVLGRPVELPIHVSLPMDAADGEALPILWARGQIEDKMIDYLGPALTVDERNRVQQDVTRLGLEYRLLTQWTSFVAVSRAVVNPTGSALETDVPVPQAEGVPASAYPHKAAPEPAEWAAMLLLACVYVLASKSIYLRKQ